MSTPAYRYGLMYRPASIGAVPPGHFRLEDPLGDEVGRGFTRHGVIVFDRPLTDKEISAFELAVLADMVLCEQLAGRIALDLGEYAAEYVEEAAADPHVFRQVVMQRLKNLHPYSVHVGPPAAFADLVRAHLETSLAKAGECQAG